MTEEGLSFNSPVTMPAGHTEPPSQPNKKMAMIVVGFVILLIVGVGFGAFYYFSNITLTPEDAFSRALDNLKNVKSESVNYDLSVDFKPKTTLSDTFTSIVGTMIDQNINFKVNSKTDFVNNKIAPNLASETTIDLPTTIDIPLVGAVRFSPTISYVMADKENFYLKIKGIPPLGMIDLSSVNDKWIRINLNDLHDQYGFKVDASSTSASAKEFEDWRDKIIVAYNKNSFIKLTSLGYEKIDNENSYHLKMDFDKEAFKKFAMDLDKEAKNKQLLSATGTDEYLKNLDEQLKSVTIGGEVWIGKKTLVFRKVVADFSFDDKDMTIKISQSLLVTNYNKAIKITAPVSSTPFKDVMSELTSKMMSASDFGDSTSSIDNLNGEIDNLDYDQDGLSNLDEKIYGTDPNKADTDGDGYKDGDEVMNGYDPKGPGKLVK